MKLRNIYGAILFTLEGAKTVLELVNAARAAKADLRGADLTGAVLTGADLTGAVLTGAVLTGADLRGAVLTGADLRGADLRGAVLRGAVLRGAEKIADMRVFTGLYRYQVWAVVWADGRRSVRMGCLFKTLEEWETIGIRKSNVSEYPDDGSLKCEERVRAFEFAKTVALLLEVK